MNQRLRILIMGAGGRDFHVFNTVYRGNSQTEVLAFTAAQIPHIEKRVYPPELSGPLYPNGVPIRSESDLEEIIREQAIDRVVFAYSDVSFDFLEEMSKRVAATGAEFQTFDPEATLLEPSKPCIAVCAVRTGCGKSPFSRYLAANLQQLDINPGIIRHPMPYGNLSKQIVQRFATVDDLAVHQCTIEEMEEYEPHIEQGNVVFAGTDYEKIVAAAEMESDVLLWDGGNNDTPFIRPHLLITLLDPLRAGDELAYFPGKWNFEQADVLVISKIDQATPEQLVILHNNIQAHNPEATVIEGRLSIDVPDAEALQGKRVLVVEDGPTITHGGMAYGAGFLGCKSAGAELVDPRDYAVGEIAEAWQKYPHIGPVLPALGYGEGQLKDLHDTIEKVPCDVVVFATPIDLGRVVDISQPTTQVTYSFEERGSAMLPTLLKQTLGSVAAGKS
ncbi:MAG: hypothetical protein ACR2NP_04895 [Pirellulaceae bacterium]